MAYKTAMSDALRERALGLALDGFGRVGGTVRELYALVVDLEKEREAYCTALRGIGAFSHDEKIRQLAACTLAMFEAGEPGAWRGAVGAVPWKPGDPTAEEEIRAVRDADHANLQNHGITAGPLNPILPPQHWSTRIVCDACGVEYDRDAQHHCAPRVPEESDI